MGGLIERVARRLVGRARRGLLNRSTPKLDVTEFDTTQGGRLRVKLLLLRGIPTGRVLVLVFDRLRRAVADGLGRKLIRGRLKNTG